MNKFGVVLVGHGSKEPYNKSAIEYFAKKIRKKYPLVRYSFVQINEPPLQTVLEEMAESGVDRVIVQPVFLTRGVHVDQDIPKILGLPKGSKTGTLIFGKKRIAVVLSEPIGEDDRIADILSDRIAEALRD
ncbi:MAG: sirohydrochlorin nickelochelatase [Candidatus Methanomethylicaceae archaeon]|nr:sirohydrochlorin nickelochelatase [Candidatus Verstraetearchaeota archaeon]